jgi:hypothetical protein
MLADKAETNIQMVHVPGKTTVLIKTTGKEESPRPTLCLIFVKVRMGRDATD